MLASIEVEEALLLLKIAFLVLLYLFIWRIVRTASRDLRAPQESFVLAPQQAQALGLRQRRQTAKIVVVDGPGLARGTERILDSAALTVGRGPQNDLPLPRDEFVSARHARFEPRRDGVWVADVGSANGTYVNGNRLDGPQRLSAGDLVRIGETDLRLET
jgi:pSer/pThr/pTyr-binding forkhead associated (FHA) protein